MKTYTRQTLKDERFSLHYANIINIYLDDKDLLLESDYGYSDLLNNRQIDGNIRIKEVSLEDSYVYLMEYTKVLCGNPGKFTGEKMTLKKFLKKFKKGQDHFEIIDEYHAYKSSSLTGFFNHKSKIKEIRIDIYYHGDFDYELEN